MTRAERLMVQLEIHLANALDTLNALRIQQELDKQDTEQGGSPAPDIEKER